jgi:flagellar biosynthesis/type III secretory pathway protein FliH
MAPGVLLKVTTPIQSIQLLDERTLEETARSKAAAAAYEQSQQQLAQACAALSSAAAKLDEARTTLFSSHREQIVRLSLEIAAKILAKETADGNYAIEKIVLNALQSLPPSKQITIRLNPDDVKTFEKAVSEEAMNLPPNTEIAADWAINPAECVIDSELGMVESLIDEHLKQIGEALLVTSNPL